MFEINKESALSVIASTYTLYSVTSEPGLISACTLMITPPEIGPRVIKRMSFLEIQPYSGPPVTVTTIFFKPSGLYHSLNSYPSEPCHPDPSVDSTGMDKEVSWCPPKSCNAFLIKKVIAG